MEFPGRKQGDQTMFHDPMQTYAQLGAYSPINPAAGLNPLTATPGISPQLGPQSFAGNPIYGGINPQQLHLAATLAAQTAISQLLGLSPAVNPLQQMVGQQTPWAGGGLQNPLLAGIQQHPLAMAGLQHPLLAALQTHQFPPAFSPFGGQGLQHQLGYAGLPYGQQQPYGQIPSPYGQLGLPLAPQTWIGQAGQLGGGQQHGQIHPLLQAQLAARALQAPGVSPWAF